MGMWLGTVVAVSFLVAPRVFGTLPRETAGDVMTRVFSGYYWLGIGFGAVAIAAGVALSRRTGWTWERWLALGLLLAMVGAAGYTRLVVMPDLVTARQSRAQAAEGEQAPFQARVDTLHTLSVRLNGAVLLGGALVILLEAVRAQRKEAFHDAA